MGKFPIALYTFFCNTQQQGAKRANKDSIISPGVDIELIQAHLPSLPTFNSFRFKIIELFRFK